jgi:hypothetical protein
VGVPLINRLVGGYLRQLRFLDAGEQLSGRSLHFHDLLAQDERTCRYDRVPQMIFQEAIRASKDPVNLAKELQLFAQVEFASALIRNLASLLHLFQLEKL